MANFDLDSMGRVDLQRLARKHGTDRCCGTEKMREALRHRLDGPPHTLKEFGALTIEEQRDVIRSLDLTGQCDLRKTESMASAYASHLGHDSEELDQ